MNKALRALKHYGLRNPQVRFIRHNENETYHVADDADEYLLRVHSPAEGFDLRLLYGDTILEERLGRELLALRTLSAKGFRAQTPILTNQGAAYTLLEDCSPVSLLTWVAGKPLLDKHVYYLDCVYTSYARTPAQMAIHRT